MVNNSTNINKMNNHLSPQIIEHKKIMTYDVGNPSTKVSTSSKMTTQIYSNPRKW